MTKPLSYTPSGLSSKIRNIKVLSRKETSPPLAKIFISNCTSESSSGGNPLAEPVARGDGYEMLNKVAALQVCETFLATQPSTPSLPNPRAFVYVSAEDIFRPFISARYINTKRETELSIRSMVRERPEASVREVFIRPSLIYHPHFRPLTSPVAALLDLSATIHSAIPRGLPSPAALLRTIASTFTSPVRIPSEFFAVRFCGERVDNSAGPCGSCC
ncbi:hypothetical protein QCA50_003085 [Cerrena zonata]|uniref:Uncharacterized protein n=1 Tax=Cerrena zonata TaxID=2478898 RepID=A0AAW0GLL0_9APHY